jgi:hypothetical protein
MENSFIMMRLTKNYWKNYTCNLIFLYLQYRVLKQNLCLAYSMPYKTRKVRGKNCYRVYNPKSKQTFAKCTTPEKAAKQMRLLRALQNSKTFRSQLRSNRATQKRRPA